MSDDAPNLDASEMEALLLKRYRKMSKEDQAGLRRLLQFLASGGGPEELTMDIFQDLFEAAKNVQ